MKYQEIVGPHYIPPSIDQGDDIFIGKFKNRKATVTGFARDEHGQPVLKTTKGDTKLFKPRLAKLDRAATSAEESSRLLRSAQPIIKSVAGASRQPDWRGLPWWN